MKHFRNTAAVLMTFAQSLGVSERVLGQSTVPVQIINPPELPVPVIRTDRLPIPPDCRIFNVASARVGGALGRSRRMGNGAWWNTARVYPPSTS